jgi:hypothetical protein
MEKPKLNLELLKKDEEPIVADLRNIGLNVDSVWDLVNNKPNPYLKQKFTGDYSVAYPILVKHLDFNYHPRTIEGIIRSLTEKQAKDIATIKILELFNKESDQNLKWVMANALRTLMSWEKRKKYPEIANTLKGK